MLKRNSKSILTLVLALILIAAFSFGAFAEDTEYTSFKVSNGYGMAAKAGVMVTIGASAEINVDLKVKCVNEDILKEFVKTNESFFSKDEYTAITESKEFKNKGFGAGLFWKVLGVCFKKNDGSYNYFKNAVNKEVVVDTSKEEEFYKKLKDISETEARLTGKLTAVGQSYIPTQACAFIEVTRIQFQDGTTLRVINSSDPVIADQNGSTSTVTNGSEGTDLNLLFD